jgi:hypothetical protein
MAEARSKRMNWWEAAAVAAGVVSLIAVVIISG